MCVCAAGAIVRSACPKQGKARQLFSKIMWWHMDIQSLVCPHILSNNSFRDLIIQSLPITKKHVILIQIASDWQIVNKLIYKLVQ